jgi:hypothetical protein
LQDTSQFLERVIDGEGGGTPLSAFLLAHLCREVTLAGPLGRVDVVATAEALDLLSRALGSRLGVPASLVGTDKVAFALCANPLASERVVFEIPEVRLGRLNVFSVKQWGKNGQRRGREAWVVWSWRIYGAQVRQVVCRAVPSVSDKNEGLSSISFT